VWQGEEQQQLDAVASNNRTMGQWAPTENEEEDEPRMGGQWRKTPR